MILLNKIDIIKYYWIREEIKEFLYDLNRLIICMDNVMDKVRNLDISQTQWLNLWLVGHTWDHGGFKGVAKGALPGGGPWD
jgi:hypothetical protein